MISTITTQQRIDMLNALADGRDAFRALADAGVPRPVLEDLLEPEGDETDLPHGGHGLPDNTGLDRAVIERVERVIQLLAETRAYIWAVDCGAYPDEQIVMRSVAADLERYVIEGVRRRNASENLTELGDVPPAPDYHYDRFDDWDDSPI